jgi:predicted RNase H-like HicB family nuclease
MQESAPSVAHGCVVLKVEFLRDARRKADSSLRSAALRMTCHPERSEGSAFRLRPKGRPKYYENRLPLRCAWREPPLHARSFQAHRLASGGPARTIGSAWYPKRMRMTAVFEPAREGGYTCFVEEIPAAISQGETLEEAKANLLDALKLVLECQRELAEKNLSPNAVRESIELAGV